MSGVYVVLVLVLLVGCLGLVGCSQSSEPKQEPSKEIRLGIVPLPHYAPFWIAKKKGFLDEELQNAGFRLQWQPFSLGPMVNEAFAAGKIDLGVMGDFPAVAGRAAGTDYRIAGEMSRAPKALALVVKEGSGIRSVQELRGKKVATTRGAYGQKLLALLLEKNGLQQNDISFVNMSMEDLAPALLRGDVDAGVMWDPILTKLESQREIRILADGTDVYNGYAVLLASGDVLECYPAAVSAVLRAYQRGKDYMEKNQTESVKLLLEDMKMPQEQLVVILKKFRYGAPLDEAFEKDLQNTQIFMHQQGLIKSPIDVKSFIFRS